MGNLTITELDRIRKNLELGLTEMKGQLQNITPKIHSGIIDDFSSYVIQKQKCYLKNTKLHLLK